MSRRAVPAMLVFRLALAIVLDTAVQILWKLAVNRIAVPASPVDAAIAALQSAGANMPAIRT